MSYPTVSRSRDISTSTEAISYVADLFQPSEPYIEKHSGSDWITPLHPNSAPKHLSRSQLIEKVTQHVDPNSTLSIGSRARYYPSFLELDIDNGNYELCNELCDELSLSQDQAQIYKTERKTGYRVRCQIDQKDSVATSSYLYEKLRFLEDDYGAEVYPRANKPVRLPFDAKLTPLGRCASMSFVELVNDFSKLQPLSLDNFPWPSYITKPSTTDKDKAIQFQSKKPAEFLIERGVRALKYGLEAEGTRFPTQWDMMRVLHSTGISAAEAVHDCFTVLQTKGYTSKDVISRPRKVFKELEWCSRAIWDSFYVADYIRRDALPTWTQIADNDFTYLRFVLGVVSYLTPRYERGRPIPLPRKTLLKFASTSNATPFLKRLVDIGFLKRSDSYQVGNRSKAVIISQPELLGAKSPYYADNTPLSGLQALQSNSQLYTSLLADLTPYQRTSLRRFL